MIRTLLRIVGALAAIVLIVLASVASYFLFLKDRPPAPRPDLVVLPEDAPPPPRGFPTQYAAFAAYLVGLAPGFSLDDVIEVPPTVRETTDVEYGRVGDRVLELDLYEPIDDGTHLRPAIIFIHGGSWRGGFRRMKTIYTHHFAELGYVTATISYRFQQEAPFPAALEDAKCAVRWMRANAERLRIDPDRIAVSGQSAGGHLALMVAYTADREEWNQSGGHEGYSSAVAAASNLYGPANFADPKAYDRREIRDFLRAGWADDPDLWLDASPITHVRPDSPPTLIFHGTTDMLVEVSQADDLAQRMQEIGATYWYDRLDGFPHAMDVVFAVNDRVRHLKHAFLEEFMPPRPAAPALAASTQ